MKLLRSAAAARLGSSLVNLACGIRAATCRRCRTSVARTMQSRKFLIAVLLLCLLGAALRTTLLAVPPVIPVIQTDLQLSGTAIGLLTGLPVILFALAALPGSILIARFGALRTLVFGVLLTAAGGGLRGLAGTAAALYAATVAMAAGIAVMQPAMPAIVRQWLPHRIGFGTALYTFGLIVGEIVPVALMIPIVLPMVQGSWRLALAAWSLPLVGIAILTAVLAPGSQERGGETLVAATPWWPDWKSPLVWRLGLIFAGVNSVYFGTNTFLPALLAGAGRSDLIGGALTALNFGQLPASILMVVGVQRIEARIWPYVAAGCLILLSLLGVVSTAGPWTPFCAGALGFCCGVALPLGLALPPLLMAPADVGRTSAAMFTISYTLAMGTSVAGGAVWDLTGDPAFAFLPIGLAVLPMVLLTPAVRFRGI
jgi:CP family cyanate transporter-like MFS transporter